jgi:hypothetical protein
MKTLIAGLALSAVCLAQSETATHRTVTLPAGTKVLLALKNTISSKNARPGDGVYLESTFPVTAENNIVIPAGTFVQGSVTSVKRAGRIKGQAEVLLHFTTLIYPNGYTVSMPGAVESSGSDYDQRVTDSEGTVKADSSKGRDVATAASSAGTGALIGAVTGGGKGAGIGSAIGGAVGLATVLLTRGNEVRFDHGTTVEMVLQRPLTLDLERIEAQHDPGPPQPQANKLEVPKRN